MESFIEKYITSADDGTLVNEEILLERRISPYATLRPGDLAALLKLHSALPFPGTGHNTKSSCSHGSLLYNNINYVNFHPGFKRTVQAIVETEEPVADDVCNKSEVDQDDVTICLGGDTSHVPAVYSVSGLQNHEMPVVGVCVDKRVCPGFRYRVRRVDTPGRYFFDGEARTLESVGMGYGQRLTFKGPTLNNNECYFWSDSHPSGFAFSVQAVDVGQKFLIIDDHEAVVGEALVQKIHEPQEETAMNSDNVKVTKHVSVALTCAVTYYHRHNLNLMGLVANEGEETLAGEAILVKERRAREATLKCIEKVFLPRVGNCTFIPDY